MNATTIKTSASFALAAAAMALSGMSFAADAPKGSDGMAITATDKVHCYNVHACKGNSDCATAEHSCKGQNGCRGEGWQPVKTEKECTEKGGKVMKM